VPARAGIVLSVGRQGSLCVVCNFLRDVVAYAVIPNRRAEAKAEASANGGLVVISMLVLWRQDWERR
jgi:hypothetical protein